jgi:hypothetical protein
MAAPQSRSVPRRDCLWNIEIDPKLFDTTPPDGYTDITAPSDEKAIAEIVAALKLYAELSGGHYPRVTTFDADVIHKEMLKLARFTGSRQEDWNKLQQIRQLVFGKQIFALKKDRSVVPHGHNNMATAFLILKGDLQGRHYDRLEDHEDHYVIKPTIDRKFGPGGCSTVSDYKDNIHWFQALTEPAYIFNIHVLNVNPDNREPTGRLYLNPHGEKLKGGLIRAPRIGYKEAHELFG